VGDDVQVDHVCAIQRHGGAAWEAPALVFRGARRVDRRLRHRFAASTDRTIVTKNFVAIDPE
jgi:hypothetical protein